MSPRSAPSASESPSAVDLLLAEQGHLEATLLTVARSVLAQRRVALLRLLELADAVDDHLQREHAVSQVVALESPSLWVSLHGDAGQRLRELTHEVRTRRPTGSEALTRIAALHRELARERRYLEEELGPAARRVPPHARRALYRAYDVGPLAALSPPA